MNRTWHQQLFPKCQLLLLLLLLLSSSSLYYDDEEEGEGEETGPLCSVKLTC